MNKLNYWATVEREHTFQNPTSEQKLAQLTEVCNLRDGMCVLDIGCGKGWLLRQWAARWAIDGTGLEVNAAFVAEARERATAEGVAERLRFLEGPAAEFAPELAAYDIVQCLGASFALGGFNSALPWMQRALAPEGVLVIGEPFLHETPPPDVCAREGIDPAAIPSLSQLAATVEQQGLFITTMIVSSADDWDRYVSGWWRAAYAWANANPQHSEREALLSRIKEGRARYLRWERQYFGWTIIVARA